MVAYVPEHGEVSGLPRKMLELPDHKPSEYKHIPTAMIDHDLARPSELGDFLVPSLDW